MGVDPKLKPELEAPVVVLPVDELPVLLLEFVIPLVEGDELLLLEIELEDPNPLLLLLLPNPEDPREEPLLLPNPEPLLLPNPELPLLLPNPELLLLPNDELLPPIEEEELEEEPKGLLVPPLVLAPVGVMPPTACSVWPNNPIGGTFCSPSWMMRQSSFPVIGFR